MATCTVIIIDNPTTGEVDFEGRLEGQPEGQLPTGSAIIFAYLNTHIASITQDAQFWFREELVKAAAKNAPEIVQ